MTNSAVRVRPPSSFTNFLWVAENLLLRTRFSLPPCAVLLFIACIRPQVRSSIAQEIARRLRVDTNYVDSILGQMLSFEVLLNRETDATQRFQTIRSEWAAYGWIAAADYQLLTYDYEYLDYTHELSVDSQIMQDYYLQEPDVHRFKTYPNADRIALPTPSADLLPIPFREGWFGHYRPSALTSASLASLLALAFGRVDELPPFVPTAAPLMLRTSPSGGARHPTEAYVVSIDVPGLPRGWYHARVDEPALERLRDGVELDEIRTIFPGPLRASFPVQALIAFTSVFDRNMYRYREPRTLRTVFMDAGHLAATVEVTARALGIASFMHHGINDALLELRLGLNGLEEGAILAIALG